MQPVFSPARDADFIKSNGAMSGWALVMGIAIVSFLVHVNPEDGMAVEQAAQGLLAMGAAAALAHGGAVRLAQDVSGTQADAEAKDAGATTAAHLTEVRRDA